ncbi:PaaI family thioesterase [Rhodococcus sp. NCIMB 12038]|uniref:PaaI family thioesterase n=1 Tax=Rhodococcus sp. NCIMB 12038 TaxID=933800 RepID=UPI0015C67E00|nr:PaaI family thioesterase [Rhodococcus sp. NCIMB 12038]
MSDLVESRADSTLAEFTADVCRRLASGLLDRTGDDLRDLVAREVDGLRAALSDPSFLDAADAPSDPPFVSPKGYTTINTNPVTSRRNPLAPLVAIERDGDVVEMTTTLSLPYQGPRGRVHGGYAAVLLDHVLWHAVRSRLDSVSFTRSLTITYEQALPIGTELTMTGRVTEIDGRKTFAAGEIKAGDVVCVRGEGLWVSPRPRT